MIYFEYLNCVCAAFFFWGCFGNCEISNPYSIGSAAVRR